MGRGGREKAPACAKGREREDDREPEREREGACSWAVQTRTDGYLSVFVPLCLRESQRYREKRHTPMSMRVFIHVYIYVYISTDRKRPSCP